MHGLISGVRSRARQLARAAAFTAAGIIFAMTGLAFLTVALWVLLAEYESALLAWSVIGAMYLLLGVCFLFIAGRKDNSVPEAPAATAPPPQPIEPFVRMAEAFAVGLQAGRNARRRPRR